MEVTVFNKNAQAYKTGNYPLFGGEEPALYDSINRPHQYLYDQMEKLKELDWSPDDVDLTETRMDLIRVPVATREIMLLNLAYQWSIDSIATSIPTLLAPFVTNSEYGHVLQRIGENECLHSDTYSNIVRQCVPDPQEVFAMVHENDKVLARSKIIAEALSNLKEVGAKYVLGMVTFEECKPYILKGLVAIYALERVSFMSSFACTFALAEQGVFIGAARLVQKILIDEMIHFETQRYVLQDCLFKDSSWTEVVEAVKSDLSEIVEGVVAQETSWNNYLFKGGRSIVGLNEGILNDWTRYCAQEVMDNLQLNQSFRKTVTCPLPWFEQDWMDLNAQQNANMESDATNYMVSAIDRDVGGVSFDFGKDFFGKGEDKEYNVNLHPLNVYSKPNCPYCDRLKRFLCDNGVAYTELRVDLNDTFKDYLTERGLRTVPQVFDVHGNYYGDCTSFIETYNNK